MNQNELSNYVLKHTQPSASDLEKAKRVIIDELDSDKAKEHVSSLKLIAYIINHLIRDQSPVPAPEGYEYISPNLNQVRLEIAAREAITSLHASGTIIDVGSRVIEPLTKDITLYGSSATHVIGPILPSVYKAYHLSTFFHEDSKS